MQLRPRQVIFRDKCWEQLDERGNTLGVAPTGAGKTVMLSAISGRYTQAGGKALIIQHRDELVAQNRRTFERVNPRASTGTFTAKRKEWNYAATFAMIQTLAQPRYLEDMPAFDLVAIDEGHHAAADSYRRTIDAAMKRNPNCHLLLVTATPNRGDKKALRGIVDNVADQITLRELIEARLLVRPKTFVLDIGVREQLAGVKKTISDYDMSQVEAIMDKDVLNDKIVEEWRKVAGDRRTVVFCSTVAHAEHVAEAFRDHGISAATIDGTMAAGDRLATLDAYDRGDIQVLTNVAVLTEGWDCPPVSCVILLRPSSYASTMIQMIGRGLRTVDPERYPDIIKDDCVVLDFGTSILMHGTLEQDVDIDREGTKDCPECQSTMPTQIKECPICGYAWPKELREPKPDEEEGGGGEGKVRGQLTEFVMTEVDLLEQSPFRYETVWGGAACIASAMSAWAGIILYQGRWHAMGGGKEVGLRHLANADDRFICMAAADDFLRDYGDQDAAHKAKRWMTEPASPRQLEFLGMNQMSGFGVTKYQAACRLELKFNEKAIRRVLEASGHRRAA